MKMFNATTRYLTRMQMGACKHYATSFGCNTIRLYSAKSKENFPVRIGCASGFWGDTSTSAKQLVTKGNIDFLVFDYLSEITMSLLTAAKRKMPNMGYAPDFVDQVMGPNLNDIMQRNIRVISNAGGVNPMSCANALRKIAEKQGHSIEVAVITGDDLMAQQKLIREKKIKDMFTSKEMPDSIVSMNAYTGAGPIKTALDLGAQFVITGRCVDSAVVLGPLMHTFNWKAEDYNRLASGSLAGHLLECGAQSTGGTYTDWMDVGGWEDIGFPIAECYEDGDFVLTKAKNTGGQITFGTVAEQLTYEIGDPCKYILPDVVCDFSHVKIEEKSQNESVVVTGAKGKPPPTHLKVCATYMDGFRTTAVFSVVGKRAIAKGRKTAESILKRVRKIFSDMGIADFTRMHIEVIGEEYNYGKNKKLYGCDKEGARETVVWMAVEHTDKRALDVFSKEIAAAGTGMAPGLCGIIGGRPKASPVLKLYSFLYPNENVKAEVHYQDKLIPVENNTYKLAPTETAIKESSTDVEGGFFNLILEDIAYTRSGDKGNNANIGVIARKKEFYPYITKHVTSEAVYKYFEHLFEDKWDGNPNTLPVKRYEMPGINGVNFVLEKCLGGGGVASLRVDPQGKSLGQNLLDFELRNTPLLTEMKS